MAPRINGKKKGGATTPPPATELTPPTHGANDLLIADDQTIRFFVQEMAKADSEIEEAQAVVKARRKRRNRIGAAAKQRGIRLEELDYAVHLAGMKDQTEARAKLADGIRYSQALGVDIDKGISIEAFAKSPYASADGTTNPAEDELNWENRGFREATTGIGVRVGYLPDGIPPGPCTQAYLKGQERGNKANADAFAAKNGIITSLDEDDDDDHDIKEGGDDNSDRDPDDDAGGGEGGEGGEIELDPAAETDDGAAAAAGETDGDTVKWEESPGEHLAHAELDRMAADGGEA